MDHETKQILASIVELLKTEIERASAVDDSVIALARAVLAGDSSLRQKYLEHWTKLTQLVETSANPHISENLKQLDELVQRLKE